MKLFFSIFQYFLLPVISFYSLAVADTDGNPISFTGFKGKKVLIVNIASNSKDTAQLRSLEQLYQAHKDSLVVLAVPSNDFGNEPLTNVQLKNWLQQQYDAHYIITQKTAVGDSASLSPLYQWLTKAEQNGVANTAVKKDFYKFLINKQGELTGIFTQHVSPADSVLIKAIIE